MTYWIAKYGFLRKYNLSIFKYAAIDFWGKNVYKRKWLICMERRVFSLLQILCNLLPGQSPFTSREGKKRKEKKNEIEKGLLAFFDLADTNSPSSSSVSGITEGVDCALSLW